MKVYAEMPELQYSDPVPPPHCEIMALVPRMTPFLVMPEIGDIG
jgi:hypothetical protein